MQGSLLVFSAVLVLAATHLVVGRLGQAIDRPKKWKSVAGGVGAAYAFLVLLPKIASIQQGLVGRSPPNPGFYGYLVHHAYLLALVGLVVHYGLDVSVERVLVMPAKRQYRPLVGTLVFVHSAASAGYFFLVGYLVGETPADRVVPLIVLSFAMVVHFLATDHGLREKYGSLFDRGLRWVFALATMFGGVSAMASEISAGTYAILNSLFTGMLIIATIKEKIPGTADAEFRPFLAGVFWYSVLLLIADQLAN